MMNEAYRHDDIMILSVELSKTLNSYQDTLRRISPQDARGRLGRLLYCDELQTRAKALMKNYKTEIKPVNDPQDRMKFISDLRDQYAKYQELAEIHERKRLEIDRTALEFMTEEPPPPKEVYIQEADPMTLAQAETKGTQIQDQIQAKIDDMKRTVAGAEAMGIEAAVQIDRQIEQGERIAQGIEGVRDNVKKADKQRKKIESGFFKDKCNLILLSINIVCLVAIICIYSFWRMPELNISAASQSDTTPEEATVRTWNRNIAATNLETSAFSQIFNNSLNCYQDTFGTEFDYVAMMSLIQTERLIRGTALGFLLTEDSAMCIQRYTDPTWHYSSLYYGGYRREGTPTVFYDRNMDIDGYDFL